VSNKLYIILRGSVTIWVKGEEVAEYSSKLASDEALGKRVAILSATSPGTNTFGELGLIQHQLR